MGLILGGPKAWKTRTQGDIVVAYHWINGDPAMVLWPLRKPLGCVPFCIGMSHAYKYAHGTGYPTRYCLQQAAVAAGVMGMDTTKQTVRRIVEVILDGLEDLIRMPPEPERKEDAAPAGTVTLFQDGRKVVEAEVTDAPPMRTLH